MPRMTFDELNDALDQAIDAGLIYKVDFDTLKSRGSRLFDDDASDSIRAPFMHAGRFENRTEAEAAAIDAIPFNLTQFPSNKFNSLLAKLDQDSEVAQALTDFANKWQPVSEKLKKLKPMIVKGRKPSTDPRKTPERSLENTGTCPVCGQNVKLKNGRMVSHGYKVRWNQQVGNCFGVGYKPVEISAEGIRAYLEYLANVRDKVVNKLKRHQAEDLPVPSFRRKETKPIEPSDDRYAMAKRNYLGSLESTINMINKDIVEFRARLDNWQPRPLPGTK